MYALIQNGTVSVYPYTLAMLRAANPQTSFPRNPGDWMAEWGVYPVAPTARPAYDLNFNIVEGTPVNIAGAWTQVWNQVPASAEEIAERTQAAADEAAAAAVKLDAFVQTFLAFTPDGLDDYIDNNTANLTAMRTLVKKLAKMLLILAQRELR
jgi:hypothetical protein